MNAAEAIARLATATPVAARVAVVVAHPDDEVLGIGSRLALLRDWTLLHITDGAPRSGYDVQRAGFADAPSYAVARRDELAHALGVLGAAPRAIVAGCVPDQQAAQHLVALSRDLTAPLADADIVVTHPYEHGHPDHDAAAFCVHAACALLARERRRAPAVIEFAGYHLAHGALRCGAFWPHPDAPETALALDDEARARKRAALDCFVTQRGFLAQFPLDERVRTAPKYDFGAPAAPGAAFYETLGWGATRNDWYARATAARRTLELEPLPTP